MSLVKAEKYLQEKGFLDHVIELEASTATVAEAAAALGVEEGMIAKTMSFLQGEQPVLILTEGTAKVVGAVKDFLIQITQNSTCENE